MKEKKILKGTRAIGLGLFFEKEKILAISDLHLGYEEMLNSQGIFVPRTNLEAIKEELEKIFSNITVEHVVILGDLKHEFGSISQQEWREVIEILRFMQKHCKKISLLKGNHDKILGPLARYEGLKIQDFLYITDFGVLFLHGDKIPESNDFDKAKTIVIGHEHPAVRLRDAVKGETFKCFLKGKFKGKNLVVLPSMNSVSRGTDLTKSKPLSPFLKESNLEEFEAWLVEDKPYYFGKLSKLQ